MSLFFFFVVVVIACLRAERLLVLDANCYCSVLDGVKKTEKKSRKKTK